jgi:hypothetical protein
VDPTKLLLEDGTVLVERRQNLEKWGRLFLLHVHMPPHLNIASKDQRKASKHGKAFLQLLSADK